MILEKELQVENSRTFANLTIDSRSLDVQKNYLGTTTTLAPSTREVTQASTVKPPPPRRCGSIRLKYCSRLPYNVTSYPNVLGHKNLQEVEDNMIMFRELVDAECSRLAYDFVCRILQPSCIPGFLEDTPVLPCRSFCREFLSGCGSRLLPKLKEKLDCSLFPEFSGMEYCNPKPGNHLIFP